MVRGSIKKDGERTSIKLKKKTQKRLEEIFEEGDETDDEGDKTKRLIMHVLLSKTKKASMNELSEITIGAMISADHFKKC